MMEGMHKVVRKVREVVGEYTGPTSRQETAAHEAYIKKVYGHEDGSAVTSREVIQKERGEGKEEAAPLH